MNGVTLPIVTLGTIPPEPLSLNIKLHSETKSPAVWACLGVDPPDMPRTPYQASEGKHSQTPTMPYHPHLHIIICTSFISSIDYNVFIVLQCHLKDQKRAEK